jgi:TolB-like protein/Tfp pilus assembly protein PilF
LLIQIAETTFPAFGLGEGAIRVVIIVLAIGLIPVIVFSWAFELTPEGLRRESEVDHESAVSRRMAKRLDRLVMVVLALAIGFFAIDKFVLDPARDAREIEIATEQAREEGRTEAQQEARDNSIAVLPFQDLSPGGDQAYFGDGLAVDLIDQLGGVPALRVTGRTSAFSFRDKDATVAEIGEALNVSHVLDGSVSKAGERVRISVQLTDTSTDTSLWSETYDRNMTDIFDIRDDITARVFDRMTIEFARVRERSRRTEPEVYDLTLKARGNFSASGVEDDQQAAEMLNRALEIDPDYVPAMLSMVLVSYQLMTHGLISDEEQNRLANDMVDRVLALDPENGAALAFLAWGDWETYLNYESAASKFSAALRAAPGDLTLTRGAGIFARTVGRHSESIALLDRCVAADPKNLICLFHLAQSYLWGDRLDEALATHRRLQTLSGQRRNAYYVMLTLLLNGDPTQALAELDAVIDGQDHPQMLAARAMIMNDLGRLEESQEALRKIVDQLNGNPGDHTYRDRAYLVAEAYAWIGDIESAFQWLEKAYQLDETYGIRGYWFHRIVFLPIWRNLHDDPRWAEFRSRVKIPQARLDALEFSVPPWIDVSANRQP